MEGKPTHKKGRNGGQPPFKPTKEQRKLVKLLAGFGIPQDRICLVVNSPRTGRPITKETLERAFAYELEVGAMETDSVCAKMLFKKVEQGNMTAIIWYMKNRMGWRDDFGFEHRFNVPRDHENGGGSLSKEELTRALEERGLPTSLFGVDVPVLELEPEKTSEDSS